MVKMIKIRTVEKLVDGSWKQCDFKELDGGDEFRLLDNGIPIVTKYGKSHFIAADKPYLHRGEWKITTYGG